MPLQLIKTGNVPCSVFHTVTHGMRCVFSNMDRIKCSKDLPQLPQFLVPQSVGGT